MKIAVVGPAGSGKTTISHIFEKVGFVVIECDKEVHKAYNNNEIIRSWVKLHCPKCFENNKINTKIFGSFIFSNPRLKEELEDLLYNVVFIPLLDLHKSNNIIVDGVMPRFARGYDQILYVQVSEEERRQRLLKRGVKPERVEEIILSQKSIFRDPILW